MPDKTAKKILGASQLIMWTIWARGVFNSFRRELIHDLFCLNQEDSYRSKLIQRQKKYILFHLVYCRLLIAIQKRKLNNAEVKRILYFSALAPLFDDLQDNKGLILKKRDLQVLIEGNKHPKLSNTENVLAKKYISGTFNGLEQEKIRHLTRMALQFLQVNQASSAPNSEKGMLTAMMYRSLLDGKISEAEEHLVKKSGYLGQFIDDIFDYYEDRKLGLLTLATAHQNNPGLKASWSTAKRDFLDDLKVHMKNKGLEYQTIYYSFSLLLHLPYVALKQYGKFIDHKGELRHELPRKAFICDMELLINRYRLIKIFLNSNG